MIDATRKTYFAPDDDTINVFLAFVQTAQKKIRIADYSFNMDKLVDVLIQKHQAGLDVSLVLDKSQSAGPTESPEVTKVKQAGIPVVIGTSDQHKIMHHKFCVIDDEWTESGSWNFTDAAAKECNYFDIEHSTDRALMFTQNWQKIHDWIQQHEQQ